MTFIQEKKILNKKHTRSFLISGIFLTRLPFVLSDEIKPGELINSSWAFPIIGSIVGMIGSFIFWFALELNLTHSISVGLAILAMIFVTGGLHEDGLADTADGFGGGLTLKSKLRIMRDSSIGVFGSIAAFFSISFRWVALNDYTSTYWVMVGLVSASIASRGILPIITRIMPAARQDGLTSDFGHIDTVPLGICIIITVFTLMCLCGVYNMFLIIVTLFIVISGFSVLVYRQIGGYTGDVLGAYQQVSEIVTLIIIGLIVGWH